MKILTKIISIAFLSLISVVAVAQDSIVVKERPKVGLVLSGGGAKAYIPPMIDPMLVPAI